MKNIFKIFDFCFLCILVLFLTTGDAYADNVLQAVRDKAVDFLREFRPVIFLLAGFGLVGFAWMAIFNKISWKWFANIAMGLFLVANMGLVIDHFATKGGDGTTYHKQLDFGDHLKLIPPGSTVGTLNLVPSNSTMGTLKLVPSSTAGTSSPPKAQNPKNDGNVTGKEGESGGTQNSDSDQLGNDGNCTAGTGIGCPGAGTDGKGTGGAAAEDK